MKLYTAPEETPGFVEMKDFEIFLAGSIEMGVAEEWQNRVIDEVKDIPDLIVFNPRRLNWDSSWVQSIDNLQFKEQVEWELDHIQRADVVFMYFAPNTKSPISLLELGLIVAEKDVVVVCPDGFWRKGNVEIMCDRYALPLYNSLDEGIDALKRWIANERI